MYPEISIFGTTLSTYSLMIVLGILAIVCYFYFQESTFSGNPADAELAMIYGAIGAFVGAKVLYLLINLPQVMQDLPVLFSEPRTFLSVYLGGGFVFYGGFYGGLCAVLIYAHVAHLDLWELMRFLMPTVPLFHFFGRIGCFLTGCCYGVESTALGIAFTSSRIAPNFVPLLPVQLLEAAGELILFLGLLARQKRPGSGRVSLVSWLVLYGGLRFVLEFFRGDTYRGFVGVFSVSQWIALFSILLGVWVLTQGRAEKRA